MPILRHIISCFNFSLSSSQSLTSNSQSLTSNCNACQCNISHKLSFSISSNVSSYPLEILFSEVWTSLITPVDGFKYYVIFVNPLTKYIWLYPLKKKSDVTNIFCHFRALVEKFFNRKIITLYTDNKGNTKH